MNFKEIFTKLTFPTDWRCTGASYVFAPNGSENVIWLLLFFSSEPTWLPVLKKSCQLLKGSSHQRSKSASIIPPVYKGTQASYFVLRWREFRYELIATEITEVSIGTCPSARGVLFWVWIRRTFLPGGNFCSWFWVTRWLYGKRKKTKFLNCFLRSAK